MDTENYPISHVNTQGGTAIGGDVNTDGGDFIGRDKHVHIYPLPTQVIPLERPPLPINFTGRKRELSEILSALKPGRVVTLSGPGGVGKSTLAAKAVWELAPDNEPPALFPDGTLYHNFNSEPRTDIALKSIVQAYREKPTPTPQAAALRILAKRQALLVLDGTEDADDLRLILSVVGQCAVLITSRQRADAAVERHDIKPMLPGEALALLQAWGGVQATDVEAGLLICRLVGGLPLAVVLVGHYLASTGEDAAEYLEGLQENPLEALKLGKHPHENIFLLIERSLSRVSEEAQQILGIIGILAIAPFERNLIEKTLLAPVGQIGRWLGELVNYGLLTRKDKWYEVSHALIHTYAREQLKVSREVMGCLAIYLAQFVREQSELGIQGFIRLDNEYRSISSVLHKCLTQENWEAIIKLVLAAESYLSVRAHRTDSGFAAEAGLKAAQSLGHRRLEGHFWGSIGINTRGDKNREAQTIDSFERALAIAQEFNEQAAVGKWLSWLGFSLYYASQPQPIKAIKYLEQSLSIAQEAGDDNQLLNARLRFGIVQRDSGNLAQAISSFEEVVKMARTIGDRNSESNTLAMLGNTYHDLGKMEQAIQYLEQALQISLESGHKEMEYVWLKNLKRIYKKLGQSKGVLIHYEKALAAARQIDDRFSEAKTLYSISELYEELGLMPQAKEYAQQSLYIHEEIGSPYVESTRKHLNKFL